MMGLTADAGDNFKNGRQYRSHPVNGTLVEGKKRRFKGECDQFSFKKKCPIYTHNGASAKFSTNSREPNYSVHISSISRIFARNKQYKKKSR